MSKTWTGKNMNHSAKHAEQTPQKVIDRLLMAEAQKEIREAVQTRQEAPRA